MNRINSRSDLIDYCLRKLGWPVLEINIDAQQLEDRIDDAFQYFADYHYNGVERAYLVHHLTQENIDSHSIPVQYPVVSVTGILPLNNDSSSMGMFDIQYQMRLNDMYTFTSTSVIQYSVMQSHLSLLRFLFNANPRINFNRYKNSLEIMMNWSQAAVGQSIIIDCYRVLDPEQYPDIYNDRWLKDYCVALIKQQWGTNLSKFVGINLPGNVQLNADAIYNSATEELNKLREEMSMKYELPCDFMMG